MGKRRWVAWAGIRSSLTGRFQIRLRAWGDEAAEIRRSFWFDVQAPEERYEVVAP